MVGVALFTVAIVTGQTMGSMFVDGIGFGPGGRRKINALRAIGAASHDRGRAVGGEPAHGNSAR